MICGGQEPVPELAGERIRLRPVTAMDASAIQEISVYDGVFAENTEDALAMLARIDADIAAGQSLHWGICLQSSGQIVGTIGFYRGFTNNVGEIGYILKSEYRGQGIMTEAVELVVDFGLERLRLKNVLAHTSPENAASIAVLRRAGFQEIKRDSSEVVYTIASEQTVPQG